MKRWLLLVGLVSLSAWAQASRPGPIQPVQPPKVKRVPAQPVPEAPPLPAEEIIRLFTQKEEELKRARERYNFRQSVRVQEFEDGAAQGEFQMAGDVVLNAQGERIFRVTQKAASTLRRSAFNEEDVKELAGLPLFILTPEQVAHYELTYMGRQPLDEITTYIFRVQPRQLNRRQRFYEGVIWVDDRDFAIVRSLGRFVAEVENEAEKKLFERFEIYRELVDDKCWFPTYLRSDDVLKSEAGETRLRLVMRYTDYQPAAPQAARP